MPFLRICEYQQDSCSCTTHVFGGTAKSVCDLTDSNISRYLQPGKVFLGRLDPSYIYIILSVEG